MDNLVVFIEVAHKDGVGRSSINIRSIQAIVDDGDGCSIHLGEVRIQTSESYDHLIKRLQILASKL